MGASNRTKGVPVGGFRFNYYSDGFVPANRIKEGRMDDTPIPVRLYAREGCFLCYGTGLRGRGRKKTPCRCTKVMDKQLPMIRFITLYRR